MFKVTAVIDAAQFEAITRLPELRGVVFRVECDEPIHVVEKDEGSEQPSAQTIACDGITDPRFGSESFGGPARPDVEQRIIAITKSEAFRRHAFPLVPAMDPFEPPMIRARRAIALMCQDEHGRVDSRKFDQLYHTFVRSPLPDAAVTFSDE